MHTIRYFLSACVCFFLLPLFASISSELDELHEKVAPYLCECNVYNCDSNTYFKLHATFIDGAGYLITNDFPFLGDTTAHISWVDEHGEKHILSSQLVSVHPEYKIALIEVEHPRGERFPFILIGDHSPLVGEWVMRLSLSNLNEVYLGEVMDENPYQLEKVVGIGSYQTVLGTPYFNLNGRIVGIHNRSQERDSFFTDITPVKDWIERQK